MSRNNFHFNSFLNAIHSKNKTSKPGMSECIRKCKEAKQTPIEKFLAKPLTTQKRLKIFVANNPKLQKEIAAQVQVISEVEQRCLLQRNLIF